MDNPEQTDTLACPDEKAGTNPKPNELAAHALAYTIEEAALRLRMSAKSVRRQIDRGNLRRCSTFGRVLIPRKDVETFMEKFSRYAFSPQ